MSRDLIHYDPYTRIARTRAQHVGNIDNTVLKNAWLIIGRGGKVLKDRLQTGSLGKRCSPEVLRQYERAAE